MSKMKSIIYSSKEIKSLDRNVKEIHFARPFSKKNILIVLSKFRELTEVTMSESTFKRMKKPIKLMKDRKIEVKILMAKGRPLGISFEKIKDVVEMHKDFRTLREISRVTGIPKSTVHYLVKKAKKNKLKIGRKTMLLNSGKTP